MAIACDVSVLADGGSDAGAEVRDRSQVGNGEFRLRPGSHCQGKRSKVRRIRLSSQKEGRSSSSHSSTVSLEGMVLDATVLDTSGEDLIAACQRGDTAA